MDLSARASTKNAANCDRRSVNCRSDRRFFERKWRSSLARRARLSERPSPTRLYPLEGGWVGVVAACLPAIFVAASSEEQDRLKKLNQSVGPRLSLDHPPNLSISLGGGRETNQDSLSNGEWSGNRPTVGIARPGRRASCRPREAIAAEPSPSESLGRERRRGWEPRARGPDGRRRSIAVRESGCLGLQPKDGW